jgi:hypothetical protein
MRWCYLYLVLVCLAVASSAEAQQQDLFLSDDGGEQTEPSHSEFLSAEADTTKPPSEEQEARRPLSWFVGLQGRLNWVPTLIPDIFFDEVPAIVGPGFAVTGSWRSNNDSGFGVSFGIGYLDYSANGPYRESGDPIEDTEYVESSLGLAYVTGTMFWSTRFSRMFALEYGFGLDFGIITGEFRRTEAFRDARTGDYLPCSGPGDPRDPTSTYCGLDVATDVNDEGEHYNLVEDSIPPVFAFPAIPQLALRFEPDPMVAIKLQVAYGIAQICFGLAAEIGVEAI